MDPSAWNPGSFFAPVYWGELLDVVKATTDANSMFEGNVLTTVYVYMYTRTVDFLTFRDSFSLVGTTFVQGYTFFSKKTDYWILKLLVSNLCCISISELKALEVATLL